MNQEQRKARTSAFAGSQAPNYPEYPYSGESGYTGGGNGAGGGLFGGGGGGGQQQYPVPYNPSTPSTSKGFSLGNFNFNEIKGMIDRMGGIDGVLNMMNKANKMMQTVQQMAPMLKLVMGSFGKSKANDDDDDDYYPRRRRRRKKKSGSRRSGRKRSRSRRRKRR